MQPGEEGRGKLRKARGRSKHPLNPGSPNGATRRASWPVTLRCREPTRGTETSQYLEEEKSNEIPQVEAIERGRAQTTPLAVWGCGATVGRKPARARLGAEAAWNGPRHEVRVL